MQASELETLPKEESKEELKEETKQTSREGIQGRDRAIVGGGIFQKNTNVIASEGAIQRIPAGGARASIGSVQRVSKSKKKDKWKRPQRKSLHKAKQNPSEENKRSDMFIFFGEKVKFSRTIQKDGNYSSYHKLKTPLSKDYHPRKSELKLINYETFLKIKDTESTIVLLEPEKIQISIEKALDSIFTQTDGVVISQDHYLQVCDAVINLKIPSQDLLSPSPAITPSHSNK